MSILAAPFHWLDITEMSKVIETKILCYLENAHQVFIFLHSLHRRVCVDDPFASDTPYFCHQTKDALLHPGNDDNQTSKACLEEGDHCDH